MWGVWLCVVLIAILLVCALLLFKGRGVWLLIGYHASPPEEKAKYDRDAVMRSCAWWCLYTAGSTGFLLSQFWRYELDLVSYSDFGIEGMVYIALLMGGIIFESHYLHKKCLRKSA